MTNPTVDNYSRDTLKDRTIPFMILSNAENPLTAPVTRRDSGSAPTLKPSDIARLRFTVKGNAIVTGGAGMLALEAVRALLEHGASGISLFDLVPSFESAHAVAACESLRQTFPNATILTKVVDITSEEAVNRAVGETVSELGTVDILLCFAGVVGTAHAADLTIQQWRRMLDINTTGSWICAQAVGKQMIKQNTGGSMVFTASISAHSVNFPQPQVAYNVSKGALSATQSIVGGGMGPKSHGRMGDPTELVGTVILLCSPAGRYINGADILVDGGGSVF
ncbi:hypothetical protein C8R43DRAFT_995371 [Mycena crocata]|nr:hypothetical protein C8R43DRAFT_995371 [Mycena crocata]